jgi:hypothetical protein
VVQVDPIKPVLKAPGAERFKLKCDELLTNFAFKFNLRRFNAVGAALGAGSEAAARAYTEAARLALARGAAVGARSARPGAVAAAADACELELSNFATTLAQDEKLLASSGGGGSGDGGDGGGGGGAGGVGDVGSCRVEAAVRYRAERKKLLLASLAVLHAVPTTSRTV